MAECAKYWWLMPKDDGVLEFSVRNGLSILVSSIVVNSELMVSVTGSEMVTGETTDIEVSIRDFTGVKRELIVLEKQSSSTTFCRTLEALMRAYGYSFHLRGQPDVMTSTPIAATKAAHRTKYACSYSFEQQIEIMRHLHPDLELSGDRVMLSTSNRKWRKKAAHAMGLTKEYSTDFGGYFKEQIAVSCQSKRVYEVMKRVMADQYMERLKVNRGLFVKLSGLREEEVIYRTICSFEAGILSKAEMNARFLEERMSNPARKRGGLSENEKLRAEVARLKEENKELRLREYIRCNGGDRPNVDNPKNNSSDDDISSDEESQESNPVSQTQTTVVITGDSDFDEFIPRVSKRKARQPKFRINYRPRSEHEDDDDNDTDGDVCDPSWKRHKNESTSEGSDSEMDTLNRAILEWDPERVDVESDHCQTSPSRYTATSVSLPTSSVRLPASEAATSARVPTSSGCLPASEAATSARVPTSSVRLSASEAATSASVPTSSVRLPVSEAATSAHVSTSSVRLPSSQAATSARVPTSSVRLPASEAATSARVPTSSVCLPASEAATSARVSTSSVHLPASEAATSAHVPTSSVRLPAKETATSARVTTSSVRLPASEAATSARVPTSSVCLPASEAATSARVPTSSVRLPAKEAATSASVPTSSVRLPAKEAATSASVKTSSVRLPPREAATSARAPTSSVRLPASEAATYASVPTSSVRLPNRANRRICQSHISSFKAGDACLALFSNRGPSKWKQWFKAEVQTVLVGGMLYMVKFDDGVKRTVNRDDVKPLED